MIVQGGVDGHQIVILAWPGTLLEVGDIGHTEADVEIGEQDFTNGRRLTVHFPTRGGDFLVPLDRAKILAPQPKSPTVA